MMQSYADDPRLRLPFHTHGKETPHAFGS